MSAALEAKLGQAWKKPPFISNPVFRWALIIGTVVYIIAAFSGIDINLDRIARGWARGWEFIKAFTEPDFTSRWKDIYKGIYESIVMTIASTVVGIAISIPHRAWRRAQHRAAADLPDLPRHCGHISRLKRDHRGDHPCGHPWLWPARWLHYAELCDHRIFGKAFGRRH